MHDEVDQLWLCPICHEESGEDFYEGNIYHTDVGLGEKAPCNLQFKTIRFCGRPECLKAITDERNKIKQKVCEALGI